MPKFLERTPKKIKRQEIMHFSRQLSAFIRAGVPILSALDVIAEESGNVSLRAMLRDVREALRSGETFSGAIDAHRRALPPFYVEMLRSAELTGRLDFVLDQLAIYIERDLEAKRKIWSALTYPAVVLVMSIATVVILAAFVLPRFKTFFVSLHATLPLTTRMLLALSDLLSAWWWVIVAVIGTVTAGGAAYVRTRAGRERRDRLFLALPVIGGVVRYAVIERFCRILASMVSAGVTLPEAMTVVSQGAGNVVYANALKKVRDEMLEGDGLSHPIARSGLFPSSVTQMIRVGEDTGTLDDQLEAAAAFYDRELGYKIKRLTTLFEPAVILTMGLVVGFVAVALVSAMYGIFRQAGTVG